MIVMLLHQCLIRAVLILMNFHFRLKGSCKQRKACFVLRLVVLRHREGQHHEH